MLEEKGPYIIIYKIQPNNQNSSGFYRVQTLQNLYQFLTTFAYRFIVPVDQQNDSKTITFAQIVKFFKSLPYLKIFRQINKKRGSVMQSVSMDVLKGYRKFMKDRAQQAQAASEQMLLQSQKSNLKQEILRIINRHNPESTSQQDIHPAQSVPMQEQ